MWRAIESMLIVYHYPVAQPSSILVNFIYIYIFINNVDTRQKIILSILMLGTLMGALDSTIVILAFPTISSSLHSDMLTAIWIILIYLLVVAVCTTQLGRIGDIYGRSRMFNTGFVIFTLGSLFCGLSPTIKLLIASRIIQALGGAFMQANSGAIVADTFPPNVRGKAFGYISLGWTSGAMLGIVLGGVITTFIGWEYIFFINIPIGIIASILGYIYIRDTVRIKAYLDTIGMLLLSVALALIYMPLLTLLVKDLHRPISRYL
jgi:MFS family permease